jgi:hypothetical protein
MFVPGSSSEENSLRSPGVKSRYKGSFDFVMPRAAHGKAPLRMTDIRGFFALCGSLCD